MLRPYILATHHRPALMPRHLESYHLHYNRDFVAPTLLDDPWRELRHYGKDHSTGVYRCWKGHQDISTKIVEGGGPGLIFEDDAVPVRSDWQAIVTAAEGLLSEYEVVALECRYVIWDKCWAYNGLAVGTPLYQPPGRIQGLYWAQGSLGYLISATAAVRLSQLPYEGMPFDLVLWNRFRAVGLVDSPLFHDRSAGSLLEQAV